MFKQFFFIRFFFDHVQRYSKNKVGIQLIYLDRPNESVSSLKLI